MPGFPLVEMCFSGQYTKAEIKKKLVGKGGAVAYFGTNDIREVLSRAEAGDEACATFLKGFCVSVAKYIGMLHSRYSKRTIWWSWQEAEGKGQNSRNSEEE